MGIDPKYRSEFSPEEFDRFNRLLSEMAQAWDDRFQLSNPKFLQRYVRGDIWEVHIHFRVKGLNAMPQEHCAVFGRLNEHGRAKTCPVPFPFTVSWT